MSPETHLEPFEDWQLFQQCPKDQKDLEPKIVIGKRTKRSFLKESNITPITIKGQTHNFYEIRQSIVIRTLQNGEIDHDRKHSNQTHGEVQDIPEIPNSDPEPIPYGQSRHTQTIIKPAA